MLKESSGVIRPPLEDGTYANNEDCIWTIQAPPGYVIQLTWMSFQLESHVHCNSDYVKLYENYTSPDKNILATYDLTLLISFIFKQFKLKDNTVIDNNVKAFKLSKSY